MKKILLTVVLGVAVSAVGQSTAQPAQGQPATPATPPAQGQAAAAPAAQAAPPVIKDPAEYNAYVAAYQQTDANAKISGLEAFLTQYPNSVMKNQALEILMSTYQQAGNTKKTLETATKLLAADPCSKGALTLLAYYDRLMAQNNDPNAKQLLADAKKYAEQGDGCMSKWSKPDGTSDADWEKQKTQMTVIFSAAEGIAALTDGAAAGQQHDAAVKEKDDAKAAAAQAEKEKDYAAAAKALRTAVDGSPADFSVVYPLALAYLGEVPPDYQNGIWFAARAAALAPAGAPQTQVEKYARSQYVKFHAGDDGWAEFLAAAKANGPQMPIKPAPTPAEQVHAMLASKKLEDMSFAEWQFVFTNGAQADQDQLWAAIKDKPVRMNGTIISTTPTEFTIAGSSDDIDAKKADITLQFEEKLPLKMIPKDGASFDFEGYPTSYTPSPFMMVMNKAKLLLKAAPKPTTPVHHKPAAAH